MAYWHIQLHPNDIANFNDEAFNNILNHGIIGMGDGWGNDHGQPANFINNVSIGDIVLVRHNGPRALVVVTSNVYNNANAAFWFPIARNVRILSRDGAQFNNNYDGNWQQGLFLAATFQPANNCLFIQNWLNYIQMQNYIDLLLSNKNIILTGAPGTGKTYLAKEIAKQITNTNETIPLVQFHPSYDYTDFVEGLRPFKEDNKEIGFKLTNGIFKEFCKIALAAFKYDKENIVEENVRRKFVFIIDEINRGEISKIFGELFFAIDPGYRGEKGSIQTQYHNINDAGDFVDVDADGNGCFYIPENVYIIGTMNDIDRSVESFDFAMRRRFAWIEIKPEDRISMLVVLSNELKVEAIAKMTALNTIIKNNENLGSHFQIGPAYFLKLKEANYDFIKLWNYHLEILLKEYLRGFSDATTVLDNLKNAYYGAH